MNKEKRHIPCLTHIKSTHTHSRRFRAVTASAAKIRPGARVLGGHGGAGNIWFSTSNVLGPSCAKKVRLSWKCLTRTKLTATWPLSSADRLGNMHPLLCFELDFSVKRQSSARTSIRGCRQNGGRPNPRGVGNEGRARRLRFCARCCA